MGTDGSLEQIERIQNSIDHSLARVKYGLSVQNTDMNASNALSQPQFSVDRNAATDTSSYLAKRIGQVSSKMWGESSDSPVNRLLKLHREMSTIRTTAQVLAQSDAIVVSRLRNLIIHTDWWNFIPRQAARALLTLRSKLPTILADDHSTSPADAAGNSENAPLAKQACSRPPHRMQTPR